MIRPLTFLALVLAVALSASSALAHEAPTHEIEELTEAISAHPNARLLVDRAELWLQEGYPNEAAADLRIANTLEPSTSTERAILWAEVWRQRGRLAEAEAELDGAVAAGSLDALVARARIRKSASSRPRSPSYGATATPPARSATAPPPMRSPSGSARAPAEVSTRRGSAA